MKREKNISRRVALNLWLPIIVVVFILVAALGVIEVNPGLGYTILVGDVIYLIAAVLCYEYTEKISKEFLAAGFEQSQIQKQILKELPVPYVMTDQDGTIIWHNEQFSEIVGQKITKKSITQIFPGLYKKVFPQNGQMKEYCITHEEHKYHVECRNMVFKNLEQTEGEIQEDKETQGDILQVFYFFDETQLIGYKEESRKKSLVAGLIYIDNYEEVLENMEEVRQSLLLALVERKIMKYMQGLDAIIKGFEKDKFLFVFEEEKLEQLMESKFSILDEVRLINIGNELSMTLSIGVGVNGGSYTENYESARVAMDLALGRGGDQAVVRDGDAISYYGGKTQKVEKSKRVNARVKAHALREIMLTHDKIFVMGHKNPDADCVGAALGIYRLSKALNKSTYIVMDKDCPAIEPIVDGIYRERADEEEDIFVTNEEAMLLKDKSAMLIVVDVNVPAMTECPELLKSISTIVVLDHHRQSNETIKNAVVSYVEPYASSTCEMVAEILQYIVDKPKLKNIEADAMYSGILVDTDNFVIKAGVRTFEAASYLRRLGLNTADVKKLFNVNKEDYDHRADIVKTSKIIVSQIAVAKCYTKYPNIRVIASQAADEMLNIGDIRASIVVYAQDGGVGISARSLGDINVQLIMEYLGGGGHSTVAGAQVKDKNVDMVIEDVEKAVFDYVANNES